MAGQGLTAVIRKHCAKWILYVVVFGVTIGNLCEAGADIGGISAATNLLVPIPIMWLAVPATLVILSLQIFGSYELIRTVFRWVALALLAYIGSAVLAHPDVLPVLRGTFIPYDPFTNCDSSTRMTPELTISARNTTSCPALSM